MTQVMACIDSFLFHTYSTTLLPHHHYHEYKQQQQLLDNKRMISLRVKHQQSSTVHPDSLCSFLVAYLCGFLAKQEDKTQILKPT
jgi:hypothetical protein